MATLRSVNTEFWDDEYVEELPRDGKFLFLYLLTNPLANIAGAYKISRKKIRQHTEFTDVELDALLKRFESDGKVIYRDGWMFLPNFLKNQSLGGNLPKTALNLLLETPDWIQASVSKAITESPKLTATFVMAQDLVLCLKTKSGCIDTQSAKGKEEKGREDEDKTPLPPRGGNGNRTSEKPLTLPKGIEMEVQMYLDGVATIVGAKDGKDLAQYKRWREVAEQCVRAERFMPKFLDTVRMEFGRNKESPQFFTPEGCLKAFQAQQSDNGGANKPREKLDWQIAIERCGKCDDSGILFENNNPIVCKHDG